MYKPEWWRRGVTLLAVLNARKHPCQSAIFIYNNNCKIVHGPFLKPMDLSSKLIEIFGYCSLVIAQKIAQKKCSYS